MTARNDTLAQPNTCPFAYLLDNDNDSDKTSTHPTPETATCPVKLRRDDENEASTSKPRCPLGFTSNNATSRLSSLHCVVCKSILCLPHTTPCGHTFCRDCVRSESCVVCGATVRPGSLTPNAQLEEMLESFLAAHAGTVSFYDLYDSAELVAALKKESSRADESTTSKATFYMTAGMVSAMGGNETAAWRWYFRARAVYLDALRDPQHQHQQKHLEKRLGILYGVLGDLNRSLGYDDESVCTCYGLAIAHLGDPDDLGDNDEYQRALSAVLNKVGEVHHSAGDVDTALGLYTRALDVRKSRKRAAENRPTEMLVTATLDLVTSYAKVADAHKTLGMHAEHADAWSQGRTLLASISGAMPQVRLANAHTTYSGLQAHFFEEGEREREGEREAQL